MLFDFADFGAQRRVGAMSVAALLLAVSASPSFSATNIASLTDEQFDTQFRCPEAIADEDERSAAVADFVHWAKARHSDWTIMDIVKARIALLTKHRCVETLKTLPPAAITPQ